MAEWEDEFPAGYETEEILMRKARKEDSVVMTREKYADLQAAWEQFCQRTETG